MEDTTISDNFTKANDEAKPEEILYSLDDALKKGVEEGNEHALYTVACSHLEKNEKTEAIRLFEKAAEQKNIFAMIELAKLLFEGGGGVGGFFKSNSEHINPAFRWVNQAAGLGRTDGLLFIAEEILKNGHPKDANHIYELAMYYSFDVETLLEFAELKRKCEIEMVKNGQPNYRQMTSTDCLLIAAYKGSCDACLKIAKEMNNGESMFRKVAAVYYEVIHHNCKCDKDHRQEIDYGCLGKYYNYYDDEKSIIYYEIAISKLDENDDVKLIDIFGQIAFSYLRLNNHLVAISYYEKFISLYEKIKTELDRLDGSKKIAYYVYLGRLAKYYYDGVHVEKDYSKTHHYLSLIDFSGNYDDLLDSQRDAKNLFAMCYYNGYGVPVDMMKAHSLFNRKMKDKYFSGLCKKFPHCDSCERCEKFKKNQTKQNLICPDYPECKNDDCEYDHQLVDSKFRTVPCRHGAGCKFHKKGKCTYFHAK